MKTAKRPHKGSLLPILRVRQDARENLIRHFNTLPVREGLRFWIDTEVRWLIVSAKMYLVFGPFMSDSEWFTGAKESLERFGKLALKMAECIDSMPHSAWEGLLRQVAPKVGTPLFLSKGFFPLLAEMTLALAKRPAANPKGGRHHKPTGYLAMMVAERTASVYTLLTGKPARPGTADRTEGTLRNEFERLLEKVYANLGIDASG
jgi:hypothetical protein